MPAVYIILYDSGRASPLSHEQCTLNIGTVAFMLTSVIMMSHGSEGDIIIQRYYSRIHNGNKCMHINN